MPKIGNNAIGQFSPHDPGPFVKPGTSASGFKAQPRTSGGIVPRDALKRTAAELKAAAQEGDPVAFTNAILGSSVIPAYVNGQALTVERARAIAEEAGAPHDLVVAAANNVHFDRVKGASAAVYLRGGSRRRIY